MYTAIVYKHFVAQLSVIYNNKRDKEYRNSNSVRVKIGKNDSIFPQQRAL